MVNQCLTYRKLLINYVTKLQPTKKPTHSKSLPDSLTNSINMSISAYQPLMLLYDINVFLYTLYVPISITFTEKVAC
jgi:hypothetical protein